MEETTVRPETPPSALTLDLVPILAPVTVVTLGMVFPVLRSTTALGEMIVLPTPPAPIPALELSAVSVILDSVVMDTVAHRLITAHKHRFHVRQLAQRVPTRAQEHSFARAIVGIQGTEPFVLPLITARLGEIPARLGELPPAITPDQELTPALAMLDILGMVKLAPVRPCHLLFPPPLSSFCNQLKSDFSLATNYCTLGIANCAPIGSTCTFLSPGQFSCACNPGYLGNGTTCTGKNEATLPFPSLENQTLGVLISPPLFKCSYKLLQPGHLELFGGGFHLHLPGTRSIQLRLQSKLQRRWNRLHG